MAGEVHFMLYKGNHYHLTIRTDEGHDIYVNTNDVWDDGDRVGIVIPAKAINLSPALPSREGEKNGSNE